MTNCLKRTSNKVFCKIQLDSSLRLVPASSFETSKQSHEAVFLIFSMTCSPAVTILASLEECVLVIKIVNISNNSNLHSDHWDHCYDQSEPGCFWKKRRWKWKELRGWVWACIHNLHTIIIIISITNFVSKDVFLKVLLLTRITFIVET